ncbi:YihY/virulence factor BrkB family protein [Cucumibacter marinus]|uniref:YihY/virulence factor BrkB family protein n=1 Tax=Cucumibacter marinus TaxID=1121252 RepID=UPI000687392D|nr:YihY/virulence factor BrkB family protein [Cucumibacter marinus]
MPHEQTKTESELRRPDIGRQADKPRRIAPRGWKQILRRTAWSFLEDRVMLVSAGVTLYMLIALVPALSIIVSIYGLFSDPVSITEQMSLLQGIVPPGGLELLRTQLTRIASESDDTLGLALLIALAVALWGASLGVKGLFEAMNIAYGETEKRGFIHLNLLALLLTFGAALLAVISITIVVVLPAILAIIPVEFLAGLAVRVLSFAFLTVMLIVGLAVLYRLGPSRTDAKWRWVTPGALFAVIAILVVSSTFSWYVANFGNYSATYGSLGAIIGFLTWLWISIMAVVMGDELNAEAEHQSALDTTIPPEKPMGQRGAYVADTLGD